MVVQRGSCRLLVLLCLGILVVAGPCCSQDWLSFLAIAEGDASVVTVPMQTGQASVSASEFHLSTGLPIGNEVFQSGHIYGQGLVSFGSLVFDHQTDGLTSSANYLIFPFHWTTQKYFENTNTQVQISVQEGSSPQMELVSLFIRNKTGNYSYNPHILLISDWKNISFLNELVTFQAVVTSDLTNTYAIFTYYCPHSSYAQMLSAPSPIVGTIGVTIPPYPSQLFRYSDTPHAIELRCLNIKSSEVAWFNLVYQLTGDVQSLGTTSAKNTTNGSCLGSGFSETSCCQLFTDPTVSCQVRLAETVCYCDALCFERGDCCEDIEYLYYQQVLQNCVPTCVNKTVMQQGEVYYSEGPLFLCDEGVPVYVSQDAFNIAYQLFGPGTTIVTCKQLQQQEAQGFIHQPGMLSTQSSYLAYSPPYCTGFEETLPECFYYFDDMDILDFGSLAVVNCTGFNASSCLFDQIATIRLLSSGEILSNGVVEICFGVWVPLCGEHWNFPDAMVACSELGYIVNENNTYAIAVVPPIEVIMSGLLDVIVPNYQCQGTENFVSACTVIPQQCSVEEVAYVDCNYTTSPMFETFVTPTSSSPGATHSVVQIVVIVGILVLVILLIASLTMLLSCFCYLKKRQLLAMDNSTGSRIGWQHTQLQVKTQDTLTSIFVNVQNEEKLTKNMTITSDQLRLMDSIGQGEFSRVYKAHYFPGSDNIPVIVAVKTLKETYSQHNVQEFLTESLKMQQFDHPNVMGLLGVCLDAGPTPYIVLPYMSGGDLLSYVRDRSSSLVLSDKVPTSKVNDVRSDLLVICLQVAKGMEYIASQNVVHRDLAARNCMITKDRVIKVSDFGLSKSTYERLYFRQDASVKVKLPVKWMALESLQDGVFSEKTDVWSYGVTCWEVFTAGQVPFPGINPINLPRLMKEGHRPKPPKNRACSDEIYQRLMTHCWDTDPNCRPTFSELVTDITALVSTLGDLRTVLQSALVSVMAPLDFGDWADENSDDFDSDKSADSV